VRYLQGPEPVSVPAGTRKGGGIVITVLGFGLCVLGALFTVGAVLAAAVAIGFRQWGLLALAAIFGAIAAVLIGAAVAL